MSQQTEQIWNALIQAGVVEGAEPDITTLTSPWYVKVLLAFSGWLAALFLLGFIGVGFDFIVENSAASLVTGGGMIGAGYFMLRQPKNEFFQHFALALSLAGQALVGWALFDMVEAHDEAAWALLALVELLLAIVIPQFTHRVITSFLSVFAMAMALNAVGIPYLLSSIVLLLASWLWLNELRFPGQMSRIRPIGYGLVLALVQLKGTALFGYEAIGWRTTGSGAEGWVQPWMGEVLSVAVLLYVVWQLLQRLGRPVSRNLQGALLFGALLVVVASLEARGITVGIVIMLLGYAGGNRVLLGVGIVSLLFYISSYYYLLDATLLTKAQILLGVGLTLLAVRWGLLRLMPSLNDKGNDKTNHKTNSRNASDKNRGAEHG